MSPYLVHRCTVITDRLKINSLHCGLIQNVTRVNCDSVGAIAFFHVPQGCTFAERCFIEHACYHAPVSVASKYLIELEQSGETGGWNMRTLLLEVL